MSSALCRGWSAVVCCASGPSFSEEQAALIEAARAVGKVRVIVVNDNWRRVPNADVLYAGDGKWYDVHIEALRKGFNGECWTQDEKAVERHGLHFVQLKRGNDLLPIGDHRISCGSNSGFQSIMLARLFRGTVRPEPIILVGFDMAKGATKHHWFGSHPLPLANGDPRSFIQHFNAVAPALKAEGTDVVNCAAATALTCFRRADLAQTLAAL